MAEPYRVSDQWFKTRYDRAMARPRLRTPGLRHAIIAAAVDIFDRAGPEALTTRSVASAAGTSPAAIAELFGGKSGLLAAVAAEGFTRLHEQLSAVEDGDEPRQELVDLAMGYRRFSIENHHMFNLMFSQPVAELGQDVAELDVIGGIYNAFVLRFSSLLRVKVREPLAVDSATGFVALLQGLAMQERAATLGSTTSSTDRRWAHAVQTFLTGTVSE